MRATLLVTTSVVLCLGLGCSISIDTPGSGTPLDETHLDMTIAGSVSTGQAEVDAKITAGWTIELDEGQAIYINGQVLTGPNSSNEYVATVTNATEYTIEVIDPTVGADVTTIAAPATFDITAPAAGAAASLSGFTVTWSDPDPAQDVLVTVSQSIFGVQRDREFGPFADTGSLTLSADNLRSFGQGAQLLISVTKIRERTGINGFQSADVSVELTRTVLVTPGP
ncbi:MAG: hypothetical protein JXO22_04670 [Phycisphaerae bacterium]|nr:hypothetical protein [Phycisphaerae bacterium]